MKAVSWATCELMIGSLEYARRSGISDIITVIDPVINRVLKRSDNAPYDYVGSTRQMGKVAAMAALLDCTEERINRVRAFAGIGHDVFLSDDAARALLDRRAVAEGDGRVAGGGRVTTADAGHGEDEKPVPVTPDHIRDYCREQLQAARTERERADAQRLIDALLRQRIHPPVLALVKSDAP